MKALILLISLNTMACGASAQIRDNRISPTLLNRSLNNHTDANTIKARLPESVYQSAADNTPISSITIPEHNAAARGLPFFCRQELHMDKKLPMQVRLRMGSVQHVDWLEQKPGAIAPR